MRNFREIRTVGRSSDPENWSFTLLLVPEADNTKKMLVYFLVPVSLTGALSLLSGAREGDHGPIQIFWLHMKQQRSLGNCTSGRRGHKKSKDCLPRGILALQDQHVNREYLWLKATQQLAWHI